MAHLVGQFLWYEFMAKDKSQAIDFYSNVMGWGTRHWKSEREHDDYNSYTMLTNREQSIGGITELLPQLKKSHAPPQWIAYVGVDNANESTELARTLGAEILLAATKIDEIGTFSFIQDPQGATIALYAPAYKPNIIQNTNQTGQFTWHELGCNDPNSAWQFYQSLFAWQEIDVMDNGEMGTYRLYGLNGTSFGGMFKKPADQSGASTWLYYTTVEDLDNAVNRVSQNGGTIINGPMKGLGNDKIVQCRDSQGGAFALHVPAT